MAPLTGAIFRSPKIFKWQGLQMVSKAVKETSHMNLTKNVYLAALMNANSTNQDAVFSSRDRLSQSDCVMQILINITYYQDVLRSV